MTRASFGLTAVLLFATSAAQGGPTLGPAQGFDIHIVAPHVVEGVVMGPFHHFCKLAQQDPLRLECLLYESAQPDSRLVGVEYFIDKTVTRPNVPLEVWNRLFHDHELEIAAGRVQILDRTDEDAEALAAAAARTDGIIWKLWMEGPVPDGRAIPAQALGHRPRSEAPDPAAR